MAFDGLHIDALSEIHLRELIANRLPESTTLEFKSQLPGSSKHDKKEFVKDVSAMANSSGGHLVYGISEAEGVANTLHPIEADWDSEIRRLEQLARTGLDPRVVPLRLRAVPCSPSGCILVVDIRRSLIAPHMVVCDGVNRFYSRHSASNHPMDTTELRHAFSASSSLRTRLLRWRAERIALLQAGDSPVALSGASKLVLHLVPLRSLEALEQYDLTIVDRDPALLGQIDRSAGFGARRNFDGVIRYSPFDSHTEYVQLFRDGTIEAATSGLLHYKKASDRQIYGRYFEQQLIDAAARFLKLMDLLGVPPPVAMMLSLLNVKGFTIVDSGNPFPGSVNPIDRDDLFIYPQITDSLGTNPATLLRPLFDAVWNAAGVAASPHYSADGTWSPSS